MEVSNHTLAEATTTAPFLDYAVCVNDGKVKMDPSGDTKVKNDAMKMKADPNGETKTKQ